MSKLWMFGFRIDEVFLHSFFLLPASEFFCIYVSFEGRAMQLKMKDASRLT